MSWGWQGGCGMTGLAEHAMHPVLLAPELQETESPGARGHILLVPSPQRLQPQECLPPPPTLNSAHSPCCECHLASPDSPGKDMEPSQVPSMDSDSWCFSSARPDLGNGETVLSGPQPQQLQSRGREEGRMTSVASPHLLPSSEKEEKQAGTVQVLFRKCPRDCLS